MSKVEELIELMSTNDEIRERVTQAGGEEKRQILNELGFGEVTVEDFQNYAQNDEYELSEEDLEAVAGGDGSGWLGAVTAAIGAAAAAAA